MMSIMYLQCFDKIKNLIYQHSYHILAPKRVYFCKDTILLAISCPVY